MVLFGGGPTDDHTPNSQTTTVAQEAESQPQTQTGPDAFDEFDLLGTQFTAWDGPSPEGDELKPEIKDEPDSVNNQLTYLGVVQMGARQRALMSVDGKQRFMKEGQSVGRMTLVSIAPDHVMIRRGRANLRIDLLAESADRLGYLGSNGPPVRLSNPNAFNGDIGMLDPSEVRRRVVADGIEKGAGDSDDAPAGVPAAKARSIERARNAERLRNARNSRNTGNTRIVPGVSSDGQEGP